MESSNADGIESKQTNARTDEYTHQEQKLTVLTPEAAPASFNVPQLPSRSATKYDSAMREQSTITTTTNERNDIVVSIPNEATKFETANTNILGESTTPAVVQNNTCSVTCTVSIRTVGSICCRICHNTDGNDRLISPCLCKGTLAYVHRSCLEHWLSTSRIVYCELCQYRFSMETMLRYTFCQSIRIWYRHPNNRGLLQADCLVCTLLTVVTFGLVAICMLGLQYFNLQSYRFGVSRLWTQGSIIIFLVIVNAELHKIAAGMQGEMTCWDSREVGEYGVQHFKEMKTAYGRRIAVFLENKFLFLPPRFSENYLEAACQPQQDREPLTRL